jgi:hypothetical protein
MYNEEDEPDYSEPEVEAKPADGETLAGTVSVQVSRDEIVRLVSERFYANLTDTYGRGEGIRDAVKKTLARMVRDRADEAITKITDAAIHDAVASMLSDGWSVTDSYGREQGRMTIKQFVIDKLTKRVSSYRDEIQLDKVTDSLLQDGIAKELQPLLNQAKERMSKVLDNTVATALKKALLEGAGLRA